MSSQDKTQRSILPIPDPQYVGLTTYDAKNPDTKFPPIEPLRPPKGAPNVLIVLIDDCGFGASSPFGGPIATSAGRSGVRAVQPGSRGKAAAHQGQYADPVRRHGPADRELGGLAQE